MTLVATGIGVALLPPPRTRTAGTPQHPHRPSRRRGTPLARRLRLEARGRPVLRRAGVAQAPPRRRGSAGKRKARMTASGAEADPDGTPEGPA